ncbi:FAD-dependent oxidoreductase [Brevundimonas faecalis]|uniref:Fumarate reductase flavoprotein subunit n=1 Tax=Brevundimonas faecalis TaxID=947378 RepID=A0ABV2RBC7_9CAUL
MSEPTYDFVIVGAGPAGLTAAIAAADRGARVALLETADRIGGALLINRGQLSGAGTRLQAERGIVDTPQAHFDDAMRLSRGTTDPDFLDLAVRLQGPFVDWLMDNGFEMEADMPRTIHGNEAYSIPRTYWGREEGLSILKVLAPMIERHAAAGLIDVMTKTEAERLLTEDGRIVGLETRDGRRILGNAVVLASGGYAANAGLFSRLHDGYTLWSGAYEHCSGKGIEMGEAVGGAVILADTFMPNFGGFLDHTLDPPRYRAPGGLTPQDRPPWEIIVNRQGRRFYREDNDSVDERTVRLMEQDGCQAWVIYDEAIRGAAPTLFTFFPHNTERFYEPEGCIVRAETLADLAEACGIAPGGLTETVARYNAMVEAGRDEDFGRTHMPRAIEAGPFYALPIVAYTVRGYAGLKVDLDFRVLDADDRPVPGLYAVGEILGSLLSGKGSVGGMSLAPALAFGRHLGERAPLSR